MKSSTIWVSMKAKEMADQLKGSKSYNRFFLELMESYSRGSSGGVTAGNDKLMEQIKELLTSVTLHSMEREKMKGIVREEVERQAALQKKKNMFSHLV
jgi:hypothetical protein